MESILLTCIKNPFKPVESKVTKRVDHLPSIRHALNEFYPAPLDSGLDIVVSLTTNTCPSRLLSESEIDTLIPCPGDCIIFTAVPHDGGGGGGGGKDIVRAVAMLAVVIMAVTIPGAGIGVLGIPGMGFAVGGAAYTMASMGMMIAGGLLVNALLPASVASDDAADYSYASSDYSKSATYGWDPSSNAEQEGGMMPVLYGTHRIIPPIIGRYVSTSGSLQYLNILYAVCEGGKTGIDSITNYEINGNPYSYFNDLNVVTRLGTNSQSAIPYFNDTISDIAVGAKLSTSYITRSTVGNTTQGLGVGILLPNGLYYANDNGGLTAQSVTFQIEYKKTSDPSWTAWGTYTISDAQSSAIRRYYRIDNLTPGQYDVRVVLTSALPAGARYRNDTYWEYVEEIIYDDFAYPGIALMAVNALATDELSNSTPRVSCLASRLTVPVWTGAAYENKPATNPAWVCYDILHNDEYGGAVPYNRIIYEKFEEWAGWCDQNGYTCNIYFDTMKNLRKAIDIVCTLGRGNVLQIGSKFTCIYDGDTLPSQRFLFTMGNIVKDSFGEEWLPMDDRANQIEITYYDAELNYSKRPAVVEQDGFDTLGVDISPRQVDLVGCTDRSMALKHAKFLLNCNRYITNTTSFEASRDSIACLPGDIIEVAHDVPRWGYSGRVVLARANTVTLDRQVTLEPGTTYKVQVQHIDTDISEELTVEPVAATTTTDELILTTVWENIPTRHTKYSFGEEGRVTKLFRITGITRAENLRRRITAVEHVPDVYNDAVAIPAISNISGLTRMAGLSVTEIFRKSALGAFESVASLTWRGYAIQYWVYQAPAASGPWTLLGSTTRRSYETSPLLKEGSLYYFCVTPDKTIEGGLVESVYIWGKTRAPSNVTNFRASPAQGGLLLSWDAVADPDIDYYLLKFSQNTADTWNKMTTVGKIYGTSIPLPAALSGKYAVKAVDQSVPPNESENAAYIVTDVPTVLAWNAYREDIEEPGFSGTKTGLTVINGSLHLDTILGLDDIEDIDTLEDFDSLDSGYVTEGTYELPPLDLGSVQTARMSMLVQFSGFDRSQSFDEITDIDAVENWDGNTSGATIRTQISTSLDGANYTDWMDFIVGDFTFRYAKRRATMRVEDATVGILISAIHAVADLPDRSESGQDVTCGTGGITPIFPTPFMAKPRIGITIQDMQDGDYPYLDPSLITTTGFSLSIKNGATTVERVIDWVAVGY
jgi:predicted phage tail protein